LFALPKLSGPNNTRLTKERYHATVETREGMVEELRVSKPREKREERREESGIYNAELAYGYCGCW